ncbi:hypothetical protein SNE40_016550 [Patella caerulea]|uniref:Tyr recombinase domain-containing protein n=1 Tax=Patella caerulea TaxID=87958 RepID=A0AAN8PCD7_PATCE
MVNQFLNSFFYAHLQYSLKWAGLDSNRYKGHSFRIGGATTALMMGINERTIQQLGRWKSNAFQKYIRIPALKLSI